MTTQTRISDLVSNPGVLSNVVVAKYRTNNSLITSGLAVGGPEVDLLMSGGSQIQGLNFINKVDTSTFNLSSDDFDEKGAVGKVTASPYSALRFDANWGWAYTDLTRIITKYDVRGGLMNAIPMYWSEVSENIAVASIKGALGTTSALITGALTDAFSLERAVDVAATMDDPRSAQIMITSRKSLAKLQKSNINAYKPMAETNLSFDTYAGYKLLITEAFGDQMTVVAQEGALAFAAGLVPGTVGMEIKRDADAGNGGGGEILRTRLSIVAAPQGFSYTGAAKPNLKPASDTTNFPTSLANPANWTKVADTSMIGFRAFKHAA